MFTPFGHWLFTPSRRMLLTNGGVRRRITIGESDEFGFNATKDRCFQPSGTGVPPVRIVLPTHGRDARATTV